MVKNTSGGTKTKGLARKHIKSAHSSSAPRFPENELEQIVYVSKMLGNGMCEVFNNDDLRLIAHIRNKFKGRHKRSNNITANSYILIGLRDWETPSKNCDVIFVYDDYHFNTIANNAHFPIHNILRRNTTNNNNDYNNDDDDDDLNLVNFIQQHDSHDTLTQTQTQTHHDDYDLLDI